MKENHPFDRKTEQRIEDSFKNTDEAFHLLAVIDAEFQSHPESVRCFDLRIVERVRMCVLKRRLFLERGGL